MRAECGFCNEWGFNDNDTRDTLQNEVCGCDRKRDMSVCVRERNKNATRNSQTHILEFQECVLGKNVNLQLCCCCCFLFSSFVQTIPKLSMPFWWLHLDMEAYGILLVWHFIELFAGHMQYALALDMSDDDVLQHTHTRTHLQQFEISFVYICHSSFRPSDHIFKHFLCHTDILKWMSGFQCCVTSR